MIPAYLLAFPTLAALISLYAWWRERNRMDWLDRQRGIFAAAYHAAAHELQAIKAKRSQVTARGNITRAAKRKAQRDLITEELRSGH